MCWLSVSDERAVRVVWRVRQWAAKFSREKRPLEVQSPRLQSHQRKLTGYLSPFCMAHMHFCTIFASVVRREIPNNEQGRSGLCRVVNTENADVGLCIHYLTLVTSLTCLPYITHPTVGRSRVHSPLRRVHPSSRGSRRTRYAMAWQRCSLTRPLAHRS